MCICQHLTQRHYNICIHVHAIRYLQSPLSPDSDIRSSPPPHQIWSYCLITVNDHWGKLSEMCNPSARGCGAGTWRHIEMRSARYWSKSSASAYIYIEPIADGLGNGTSSMLLLSGRTAGLMVLTILFTCWTE